MANNKSDDLSFKKNDKYISWSGSNNDYVRFVKVPCDDSPTSNCSCTSSGGKIALSVILTFFFTLLLCVFTWKACFRAKYGHLLRYSRGRMQRDKNEILKNDELDDQNDELEL